MLQAFTGSVQVLAAAANVSWINVAFSASVLFYSAGAVILEALRRWILITLPLWLIANVILHKRGQTQVFWVLALLASALEPAEQITLLAGHLQLMRVSGVGLHAINVFLAPVGFRLARYFVWHIVGGLIGF